MQDRVRNEAPRDRRPARPGRPAQIAVPMRVPVLREGEVRYVLTGAMKPDAFVEVLQRQRLPDDWVVSVFDAKAQRVARSRRHAEFLTSRPRPAWCELIERSAGRRRLGRYRRRWKATRSIPRSPARASPAGQWRSAFRRAAVDAAAWRSLAAYGGGLLLSLALAVLAALFVARGIAAPIAALRQAAQALGRRAAAAPARSAHP